MSKPAEQIALMLLPDCPDLVNTMSEAQDWIKTRTAVDPDALGDIAEQLLLLKQKG